MSKTDPDVEYEVLDEVVVTDTPLDASSFRKFRNWLENWVAKNIHIRFGYYSPLSSADIKEGYDWLRLPDGTTNVRARFDKNGTLQIHPDDFQLSMDVQNRVRREMLIKTFLPMASVLRDGLLHFIPEFYDPTLTELSFKEINRFELKVSIGDSTIVNGEAFIDGLDWMGKKWDAWKTQRTEDQYQTARNMAKSRLELFQIYPSDPKYEELLVEEANICMEAMNYALMFSGGVKPLGPKVPSFTKMATQESSKAVYEISKLGNTGNFRPGALEHILEGELTAKGKAVGFHFEGMPTSIGKVIPETVSKPNKFGVYTADVEIGGVPKSGNAGASSFFPKEWTPQQVVDSVNEAYTNRVLQGGNTFRGKTASGMEIEMYLDKAGQIISAFPIY